MPKSLILFTSSYPYGSGETFLEIEIQYLATSFEQIIIVTPDIKSAEGRKVPSNAKVIRHNFNLTKNEKLKAVFGVFSRVFFNELKNTGAKLLLTNKTNLNFFLSTKYKGQKIATFIEKKILAEYAISKSNLSLYSYWWLDEAIGISFFKKRYPKVCALTRCHGYDLYQERTAGRYLPFRFQSLNTFDCIFPISEHGKNYIENNYSQVKGKSSNVVVARLGVNDGRKTERTSNKDRKFHIVSCSLIYPNKRLELIVASLSRLNFKVKWTHFGSFINGFSVDYYEGLLEQIAELDTTIIEVDLKGNVKNLEILDYYNSNEVDLFVNLSQSEGIPVSIMEAMSYSIPALATNVGGTSEIVNNENGILVEESVTIDTLAEEINNFWRLSSDELNKKRRAAYLTFEQKFNAKINYSNFIQKIENIRN